MSNTQYISCPFCHGGNFDLIGLKNHLTAGHCEAFNQTETVQEERIRKMGESK